ncbi:MAG TPA: hypothetical protein VJL54_04730 [Nitrososphaera sp.]|nr:hypothetical protein [Nitrososphaera sp.]
MKAQKKSRKMIQVRSETYEHLTSLGKKGDSFDTKIRRLLAGSCAKSEWSRLDNDTADDSDSLHSQGRP